MNKITLIGKFSGFLIVFTSIYLAANNAFIFINLPGLLIVFGGKIASTFVTYPPRYVFAVWRNFILALKNEEIYDRGDIDEIVEIVKAWRKGLIREVEGRVDRVRSPFLQTGLRLIIDNTPIEDVLDLLQWRISRLHSKELEEADVFLQ